MSIKNWFNNLLKDNWEGTKDECPMCSHHKEMHEDGKCVDGIYGSCGCKYKFK